MTVHPRHCGCKGHFGEAVGQSAAIKIVALPKIIAKWQANCAKHQFSELKLGCVRSLMTFGESVFDKCCQVAILEGHF